ncbi:hypothetical protein NSS79_10500 [Paenibacillus sp. FSL L8-0436]|uniref:hypothetical protein n=1 Tax=Paenibacillus sp. FSL L8-0436 TaxID=2954686 RepID=UPI003158A8D1
MTQSIANKIAQDLTQFLNAFHSAPEVYDDELDAQLFRWNADWLTDKSRKVWPPRGIPMFSPSAANSDARGLYEKARGAKREYVAQPPHQGRWKKLGTAIGDLIQRDIIFAEKHYAKLCGEAPRFVFERNDRGEPMFENFAKKNHVVNRAGTTFALSGKPDGIMLYTADDGKVLRVGLEVKSKQGSYSQTSGFQARKGPKDDHVKQTYCYSEMYGVDYYVILYVNASKKGWTMTPEDFAKTPDILAFGLHITDAMRAEVLDHFAGIVSAAKAGTPPKLDLDKWTFLDFKRAVSLSLSEEELAEIQRMVSATLRSSLPDGKKRDYAEALAFIEAVRAEESAKEAA